VFALITAGPAFTWSHLHLAIKRSENPFIVPTELYFASLELEHDREYCIIITAETPFAIPV
jgi:hypothetical protein